MLLDTENFVANLDPVIEAAPETLVHPLAAELRDVARAHDFVAVLSRTANAASLTGRHPDRKALVDDLASFARQGALPTLLSIELLARVQHPKADTSLVDLLSHPNQLVRRHASWRLGDRRPSERAYNTLLELLVVGGIDTMHAHRTLRSWSVSDARTINPLVIKSLNAATDPAARARIVDLLGALVGPGSLDVLLRVASDPAEVISARVAAIGAVSERFGAKIAAALQRLATPDNEIGRHAALALSELPAAFPQPIVSPRNGGLRIAQLVLARGLDGQLSLGGRGDIGGVASLLVSLGEALAQRSDVDHVHTIGLGTATDTLTALPSSSELPLSYGTIAIGDGVRAANTPDELWEQLPALERGIRRALRRAGPIDVLHLRMADAGTLAGAGVARTLGIPVCFSPAPDPHNVIQALQSRGKLSSDSFVKLATETHVWFRARLVERLAHDADRLALFPRARPLEFLDNVGMKPGKRGQRAAVVAEGIDIRMIRQAAKVYASTPVALGDDVLDRVADSIPKHRRGLPLLLSVGRLHPIKGMDRVVSEWAGDPKLCDSCNLLIVGGDLDHPTTTERGVIDTIDRIVPLGTQARSGLLMLGGKAHADVARLQAATVHGYDGYWAGGGIYVDGALKEEFGLAVLEALAAGLVVVAPSIGGPPTYVDHGDTGILVDPDADLGAGIHAAFALVGRGGRARRARAMVEQRYSIEKMAAQLVALYRPVGELL